MPAPVARAEKRTPLLTVLFWIGVALAPLAALILLVADGNGLLRFGAVLAVFAVVLIGLSIALRADGGGGTAGADELRDEIEQVRRELRGEIAAAAQRGNQALDQAQRTMESVTALRRRLDAAAAAVAGLTTTPAEDPARARASAPEPYDDRSGQSQQGGTSWGQPDGDRRGEDGSTRRPQPGTRYGTDRADRSGGTDRPQAGVYGAPRTSEPEPGPRQVGVVHHTETVHVTTRHTIVDGGADAGAGSRYGGYAGRWSPGEHGLGGAEPEERPRSGYREADDDRGEPEADRWPAPPTGRDDRSWAGRGAGRDDHSRASQGAARDDRSEADHGTGRADRSWAGQGGSREEWGRAGQGGSREDGSRPAESSGTPVRDRRGAGAGKAGAAVTSGAERSWSAGPGEQRSWSSSGSTDEPSQGGHAGPGADRSWSAGRDEPGRTGPGDWASAYARAWTPSESSGSAADSDDSDGDYWSELRSGNRWASVRDDEHGREIRVGERRAAVHADGGGSEYRVEDRWASLHEPRREQSGVYGGTAGVVTGRGEESRPALPAGGVPVPDEWRPPTQRSGQPEWRQVDPEPARYGDERYGYPPPDDAPRAGGTRSDRWR